MGSVSSISYLQISAALKGHAGRALLPAPRGRTL
jgi:hypothetical protein